MRECADVQMIENRIITKRHCELRSNPELYWADLLIGDCFVPRNDIENNRIGVIKWNQ